MSLNINGVFKVTTAFEFFQKEYRMTDEVLGEFYDDEKNTEWINLVSNIISLQIAYYCIRRTRGVCGSSVEVIATILFEAKNKYKEVRGLEFPDFNKDVKF